MVMMMMMMMRILLSSSFHSLSFACICTTINSGDEWGNIIQIQSNQPLSRSVTTAYEFGTFCPDPYLAQPMTLLNPFSNRGEKKKAPFFWGFNKEVSLQLLLLISRESLIRLCCPTYPLAHCTSSIDINSR